MPDPIRILHFADLHIGMENYGRMDPETGVNYRVQDFLDAFDRLVDYAIEHEADLVIFAGDAFRTRSPSPTHQREFAQRIRRLSEANIPTVLLVGNHDVPVMKQRASSIEIFQTLAVPHVTVAAEPGLHRFETRHGPVQVAAMPYPVRQRLLSREEHRSLGQEELDDKVSELTVQIINKLAKQLDPAIPAVLTGHFSVANASLGSERAIMVGRDVALPISELSNGPWDYVALGHIHLHQDLNHGAHPPVVYPGSLERVDFGEEKQAKGFIWLELQKGQANWRFIDSGARRFLTVRCDVRIDEDPLAFIRDELEVYDLEGAIVRVQIIMAPEQEPLLRDADVTPLLQGAFFTQVNRDIERTARDRLAGLDPDEITPIAMLAQYLRAKGKDDDDLPPYLDAAQPMFEDDGG